jgi:EAL domain-containing protein (putative c-di-GMP-specific phosphodiesterase class I)
VLRQLGALGCPIAVDDFGTGYSSLSYLKRLPIDTIKIDRGFVREIVSDADDAAIVSAIVAMARKLKLEVVAEGVETLEQLAVLRELGCDRYQGYLFSAAVPAEDFGRRFLRQP